MKRQNYKIEGEKELFKLEEYKESEKKRRSRRRSIKEKRESDIFS